MIDLTTYTDEELEGLRQQISEEQERRRFVEVTPGYIERLSRRYQQATGNGGAAVEAAERGSGRREGKGPE